MTEYIVLEKIGEAWSPCGPVSAPSARSAIRAMVHSTTPHEERVDGEGIRSGEFVAVPVRSWDPVTVSVETKTSLKFS